MVHADLWGPYRYKTHGNYNYFLIIVDDKSRVTWVYLLPNKSTVSSFLQEFITLIQNQFKIVIKTIRTDNGSEFINKSVKSLLAEFGILLQTSCVYTPQRNGLVERKHRHLLNCARTLRFHVGLAITFWGDCILIATFLINKTPTSVLDDKSPYQVLYNSIPYYNLLKVFGSLCYATIVPQASDKFAARSVKGVFLGYPYDKKRIRSSVFENYTSFYFTRCSLCGECFSFQKH